MSFRFTGEAAAASETRSRLCGVTTKPPLVSDEGQAHLQSKLIEMKWIFF